MNIVIIGAGISGKGALRLAKALKVDAVMVCDGDAAAADIVFTSETVTVTSPGIRLEKSPLLQKAIAANSRVISEMAFAFENYPGAILAITGTNGKTTTCELTGAILQSCGHADAVSGGNIGLPLSEIAADFLEKGSAAGSAAPIALEVSSFQLEYPGDFAPYAAVILNCASDHLDRHNNSMEEYKQVKYRIFDYVLPENRITMHGLPGSSPHRFTCTNGVVYLDGKKVISLDELSISGEHNTENLLAALELTSRFLPAEVYFSAELHTCLCNFRTGKHRLELFAEADGVKFYDDSKATNPAAVIAAVNAVKTPVRILAGGLDKDMDFTELSVIHQAVKKFYLIGEAAEKIRCSCGNVPSEVYKDMRSAVQAMCNDAQSGESVMLSPACASMDMFKNYAERGDIFQAECMKCLTSHKGTE